MVRAIQIFVVFSIAVLILHYLGPASKIFINEMPKILRFLASFGSAVEIPFK